MWACYLFYAGKHSATKKAESALEDLQALYRTQDSRDSEPEAKGENQKETSKPLSMLDMFKANPQPQSESYEWIKKN